jgi:uncharacterized protein
MHPDRPDKLTQPELLRLEGFLRSGSSGDSAMSLSRAHGFLTAIVSGPDEFEAGEWIRLILDEPVFDDSEQAQDILGLVMRLHADIEQSLPVAGRFSPIFEFTRGANSGRSFGSEEWCEGYLSAMALWSAPLPRALNSSLEPLRLISGPRSEAERAAREIRYEELSASLPSMAEVIYRYWHDRA